jgi:hypothetical protein
MAAFLRGVGVDWEWAYQRVKAFESMEKVCFAPSFSGDREFMGVRFRKFRCIYMIMKGFLVTAAGAP